ncbi:DUF438 domain-containing protein [uncultured Mitsuokella sp.]|uniref:DUF438 domain-containing protein n=1 Tax=uncultured Mitsuokella sp. TaxID=453120 RepID=UPI0026DBDD68|nr:DUF438 domain-containing protein [uncultured Mitsuokella sp.]
MKELDLNKSVAELVREYPELREVLASLGFTDILRPGALQLMGRIMTLPRGAVVKGISFDRLAEALEKEGFVLKNGEQQKRQARLRDYIGRLHRGEEATEVRKDFVQNFEDVAPEEIAAAEQELIKGGVPVREVQRLCDLHASLFEGHIETKPAAPKGEAEIDDLPAGHPLSLLRLENEGLSKALTSLEQALGKGDMQTVAAETAALNAIRSHYAKKEELLMPFLYDYGVTGPSQVMWGVDDEIKKELGVLTKTLKEDPENLMIVRGRLNQVITRIREMIVKEDKILFPLSLRFFTQEQWYQVYRDLFEMGMAFVDAETLLRWQEGEQWILSQQAPPEALDGRVKLPTGELTVRQLQGILKLLDVDITFIDKDDILRYFLNEGRIFSRPLTALGREVYSCHPPEVIPVVRQMLLDFKAKKRDHMEVWRRIMGRPVGVRYLAVYDEQGEYMGTVEFVQDYQKALDHFARPVRPQKG